jgi:signal peptidase I
MESPVTTIAPESRLLLEAVAVAAPARGIADPKWCDSLSWERLLEQAIHQRCAPLLCRRLAGDGAPAGTARALDRLYVQSLLRAESIQRQTSEVARAFADAGIPLMALKGVYLARTVYPDPALRPMADIDLMVPRDALSTLPELLAPLGYRLGSSARRSRWDEWWADGELCTFVAEGRRPLEFHAALGSRSWPRPAAVWKRAVAWEAAGTALRAPDPTHLLIHLIKHLVHHLDAPRPVYLIWLADIAHVIAQHGHEIDAAELSAALRRLNIAAYAALILQFCRAWLGASINGSVNGMPAQVSDPGGEREIATLEWLTGLVTADSAAASALQMERTAAARSRWRRRSLPANAAYAAGLLFPDLEYVRRHSPESGNGAALRHHGSRLLAAARRHARFWSEYANREQPEAGVNGQWLMADEPCPTINHQPLTIALPSAFTLSLPDSRSAALTAVLAAGRLARLPAVGNSMLPTIRPGDTLVVGRTDAEPVAVGEVIVWLADERLIAHRVVRLWEQAGESYFQTRGDARRQTDPVAPRARILGRVVAVERPERQPTPRTPRHVPGFSRVSRLAALIWTRCLSSRSSVS